jgi:hypothetical protein
MFTEDDRLLPEKDTITIALGLITSQSNARLIFVIFKSTVVRSNAYVRHVLPNSFLEMKQWQINC